MRDTITLRPQNTRFVKNFLVVVNGGAALLLIGIAVYAWMDDDSHGSVVGLPIVWVVFAACTTLSLLFEYRSQCKNEWVLSTEGIAIYRRGQLRRHLNWSEIKTVDAEWPAQIRIKAVSRPYEERMRFVDRQTAEEACQAWSAVQASK